MNMYSSASVVYPPNNLGNLQTDGAGEAGRKGDHLLVHSDPFLTPKVDVMSKLRTG